MGDNEALGRSDSEEKNAKCHICSSGLSYIENLLYGNRCLFCVDKAFNLRFMAFLRMAVVDWRIYQVLTVLKVRKGRKKAWELYIGCLGVVGYPDINEIKSVTIKTQLLKELRGVL